MYNTVSYKCINSLHAQVFLATKLFLISDYYYVYMSHLSFWNKPYLWKYIYKNEYKELFCEEIK